MKISRREFAVVSLVSAAGLYAGGYVSSSHAGEPQSPLPDEDGYKLWLRYAPPGDAAKNYRKVVRQIRVDGTSPTSGIIRDELRSAFGATLGDEVTANEKALVQGTVIVGKPGTSTVVRNLKWAADLGSVGEEGFIIRSPQSRGGRHRL